MTKKPNNYWNFENCKNEAIKYSCKTDFEKGSRGAHHSAISNKWINKICSHMIKGKNSNGHWNFIRCKEEALKYNKKTDFQKKSRSAYASAIKNSWLDEICQHMIQIKKPNGFWTLEKCQEEALKFRTRTDFIKNSNGAYDAAYRNNWVNEICQHMTSYKWTFDECKEIASKYKMRKEFQMNSSGAYQAAHANDWIDEICKHIHKNQPSLRHIYSYEFSDNHVYIGLTKNIKQRNYEHLIEANENKSTTVHKYINLTGLQPNLKIIYENLNEEEAKIKENEILNEYKNNNWIILNKVKTGSIGGGRIKWTFEKCQEEALKFNNRTDFSKYSSSAYCMVIKNKWDDIICKHMVKIIKYSYEICKEESLKYNNRSEFSKNSSSAYNISRKNKWLDEFYPKTKKS